MSRVPSTPPPADVPYYRYDPNFGSPRDIYTRVDFRRTRSHQPEQPARFKALVDGETPIGTMWGRRTIKWRAEPGTPCLILGSWADGTVHLKWPAIAGNYMVDGRFPSWVVEQDDDALMAGGGFMLLANDIAANPPRIPPRLVGVVVPLLVLVLILAWPPSRDALESLLRLGP